MGPALTVRERLALVVMLVVVVLVLLLFMATAAQAQYLDPTPTPRATRTATPAMTPGPTPTPTAAPSGCIVMPPDDICPAGMVSSCCATLTRGCAPWSIDSGNPCWNIRACCPGAAPTPGPTLTPPPGTPTPPPTPAPWPTSIGVRCGRVVHAFAVSRQAYTLVIACGGDPCWAVWPGGMLGVEPELAPLARASTSLVPTEDGAVVVHGAAFVLLAPQRCSSEALLPSAIFFEPD